MSITIDFSGKTVVVVGGTSGINRGIAELFARHGARVAVASRSAGQGRRHRRRAAGRSGAEAMGFAADVRELAAIEAGLERGARRMGRFRRAGLGRGGEFPGQPQRHVRECLPQRGGDRPDGHGARDEGEPRLPEETRRERGQHLRAAGLPADAGAEPRLGGQGGGRHDHAHAGDRMGARTGSASTPSCRGPSAGTEGMARLAPTEDAIGKVAASVPLGAARHAGRYRARLHVPRLGDGRPMSAARSCRLMAAGRSRAAAAWACSSASWSPRWRDAEPRGRKTRVFRSVFRAENAPSPVP
jgi:hypothetical protein